MSEVTTEPTTEPQGSVQTAEPAKAEQRDAADEPLRGPGLKALQAERERAERLESEMKPLKEQWERLQSVFGGKTEGETPEDVVKNLQQQVEQLHRVNQVNELARTFGITDVEDIARLTRIPDPELRADIAARLKPVPAAAPAAPPQADPGQGSRPGGSSDDDEYRRFFPSSR